MATFLKYASVVVLWTGLFFLSYQLIDSRTEEEVLRLYKDITNAQTGKLYSNTQTVLFDDTEQLGIQTVSQPVPSLMWVKSKTKLTDMEDFAFEVYFQPDILYLHSLNTGVWNKTDYAHPAAGELEGLQDPFAFWLRLLKHAEKIGQTHIGEQEHFIVRLQPFDDELHGIRLADVAGGTMEVWSKSRTREIEIMKADIRLKPNVIRGYERINYVLQLSDRDKDAVLALPKETQTAEVLK